MWDEWASDHEVHIHQAPGGVDPTVACGREVHERSGWSDGAKMTPSLTRCWP